MGKGSVDEDAPTFGGVYSGAGSFPGVKKAVESSDLIFWFGRYGVSLHESAFNWRIADQRIE